MRAFEDWHLAEHGMAGPGMVGPDMAGRARKAGDAVLKKGWLGKTGPDVGTG